MADTDRDRMRGTTDADRGLAPRVKVKTVKGETIEVSQRELDAAPKLRKEGLRQVAGRIWDRITPDKEDKTDEGTGTRNAGGSAQGMRG